MNKISEESKKQGRRSFLKGVLLAGGGAMFHFYWPQSQVMAQELKSNPPLDFELNSYIKISKEGVITLFNPNPEFGQNVKTSLPMILAEELDVDWESVNVEQANFYPEGNYGRQFTGGSQSIRSAWKPLREAGARARAMLIEAASQKWSVPAAEVTTSLGTIYHRSSGKQVSYGDVASLAVSIPAPETVILKALRDFKVIGSSKTNVEINNIVSGEPLFTSDFRVEGMLYAMIIHAPAFGKQLLSYDDSLAKNMPGIKAIFTIDTIKDNVDRNYFDTTSFTQLIVVAGDSTWQVMQAKKLVNAEWTEAPERSLVSGNNSILVPKGLESTDKHRQDMDFYSKKPGEIVRKDGNPEKKFKKASRVIERTYTAPYLAHNTMEPVNCFAHFKDNTVEIIAPIQAPETICGSIAKRLDIPKESVKIRLARMGGGFGRRAYGHHLIEAAIISKQLQAPVRLVYSREDEMTAGIYRPTYSATYRAALDKKNNLLAFHVKAGGIPESPLSANRFPAGAIDNYIAESWKIDSNITIGAFRAPRSNFMGAAEQSFLDELAMEMGKDPIDFRLELLDRAKVKPVGERNDYDADRYAGVLKLVKEKSNWGIAEPGVFRGVSAYFCHNTYAAEVIDLILEDGEIKVKKVVAAIDCGIVVNKDAAINMAEGAIVDAIGNAFFGELPFKDGKPLKNNFNTYRLIRNHEAPKEIDVHFVENELDPTGMGEPPFPPAFAAVANALYKATGKRFYNQPFINDMEANDIIVS